MTKVSYKVFAQDGVVVVVPNLAFAQSLIAERGGSFVVVYSKVSEPFVKKEVR